MVRRIVCTIRKHVAAEEALTSAGVGVGVDETANDRVVIAALEVIPSRFWRMLVAATPKYECFRGYAIGAVQALVAQQFRLLKMYSYLRQEAGRPASTFQSSI